MLNKRSNRPIKGLNFCNRYNFLNLPKASKLKFRDVKHKMLDRPRKLLGHPQSKDCGVYETKLANLKKSFKISDFDATNTSCL